MPVCTVESQTVCHVWPDALLGRGQQETKHKTVGHLFIILLCCSPKFVSVLKKVKSPFHSICKWHQGHWTLPCPLRNRNTCPAGILAHSKPGVARPLIVSRYREVGLDIIQTSSGLPESPEKRFFHCLSAAEGRVISLKVLSGSVVTLRASCTYVAQDFATFGGKFRYARSLQRVRKRRRPCGGSFCGF